MKVTFSARANSDLIDIGNWLAKDDEAHAARYTAKLVAACEQIGEQPTLYRFADGSRTLRRRLVTPYIIFFRMRRGEVFILSVRHGRRDNARLH